MPTDKDPLVSIALCVFNSEHFIAKTLTSLLAQDYINIELIISDNASEDRSGEICLEFAKQDNRIKYFRNISNMGPARNTYKAVDLCSGRFIMPAADHDMYHPSFISRLLELLQQDESVLLAYPRSLYIDEYDNPIELLPDVIDTRGLNACQRFSKIIWEFAWGNMIYGLYRTPVFKEVCQVHPTIGPDHVIAAQLSLLGSIAQINEQLFFRRRNRQVENIQECTNRQLHWFVKSNNDDLIPWTRMAYEHLKVISDSNLEYTEKEFLFSEVRKCFPTRFGEQMQNEVVNLISEGTKILLKSHSSPITRAATYTELARVAGICSFFYPEIKELHDFTDLGRRLVLGIPQYVVPTTGHKSDTTIGARDEINNDTVSVVIPAYNRAKLLARSIRSVQNQTYPVTEIIIADDASTDDTEEIVRKMSATDPRIIYLKLPKNCGAQAARNAGIRRATGRWISFLDSDDEFLPLKIEKQLKVALEENVDVVHCECYVQNGEADAPSLYGTRPLSGNIYARLLNESYPGPTFPGLFILKNALERIGLLDESVPSWQEWDTAIRLSKLHSFGYIAEPLFIYYLHSGQTISKDTRREAEGYAYIVEKHTYEIQSIVGTTALAHHYEHLFEKFTSCGLGDRAKEYQQKKSALKLQSTSHNNVNVPLPLEGRCHALFKQVNFHLSHSDMAAALTSLDEICLINPCLENIQFARAQCLHAMGNNNKAIQSALAELKLYPNNIACSKWLLSLSGKLTHNSA